MPEEEGIVETRAIRGEASDQLRQDPGRARVRRTAGLRQEGKTEGFPLLTPMRMRCLLPPQRPEVSSVKKLRGRALGPRKSGSDQEQKMHKVKNMELNLTSRLQRQPLMN